jgi:hypothetical protein
MTAPAHALRRSAAAALVLALGAGLAACSGEEPAPAGPERMVLKPAPDGANQATGDPIGNGTSATVEGYGIRDVTLPGPDTPGEVSFRILDAAGEVVTDYEEEQTKLLHLYVVRDDLGEFRHVHPVLGDDGTWRGRVDLGGAGRWRVVTEFIPVGAAQPIVLGTTLDVPGEWQATSVPQGEEAATGDDGIVEVRLLARGTVSDNGRLELAVTDLAGEPLTLGSYLGATAHLTGFAVGTRGFVHVHPLGAPEVRDDGTVLTFHTTFDRAGDYRLFVQVRVDGLLHQVGITATVDPAA